MTKERDFQRFMEGLAEAGRKMDPHYFQLPVADKEEGKKIFRERVYCYELYHQLRTVLGDSFPYKLYGEVDKAGHEFIPGAKKPDFIVHDPGDMRKNLVVIEVKPITVKRDIKELKNDLETLQIFLEKGEYYRAIMLIYSDGLQNLPKTILSEIARFSRMSENRIFLVWHGGWSQKPTLAEFAGGLQQFFSMYASLHTYYNSKGGGEFWYKLQFGNGLPRATTLRLRLSCCALCKRGF